jgi:hypothetical protein
MCGKWTQRARTAQRTQTHSRHERQFFIGLRAQLLGTEVAISGEINVRSRIPESTFHLHRRVVRENQLPEAQPLRADESAFDQPISGSGRFLVWLFLLVFLAFGLLLFADLVIAILR